MDFYIIWITQSRNQRTPYLINCINKHILVGFGIHKDYFLYIMLKVHLVAFALGLH